MFTEAFIYGGIFDVHTSYDSLFDSFFTCHRTLKRKSKKKVMELDGQVVGEGSVAEWSARRTSNKAVPGSSPL